MTFLRVKSWVNRSVNKPWPNRKWTQVGILRLLASPFGQGLISKLCFQQGSPNSLVTDKHVALNSQVELQHRFC